MIASFANTTDRLIPRPSAIRLTKSICLFVQALGYTSAIIDWAGAFPMKNILVTRLQAFIKNSLPAWIAFFTLLRVRIDSSTV
jgi:hypothetical protein